MDALPASITIWKTALAATLLAAVACQSHSATPVQSKAVTVAWRPVEIFSGRGSTQTQSFDIGVGQWRIKWEAKNEMPPGAGTLQVTVNSAVSGRPLEVAVDHRGPGHGIVYVNEDPRLFHLVIDSSNVDWTLAVEEAVVGAAPDSSGKP